jgi:hypothetical protein
MLHAEVLDHVVCIHVLDSHRSLNVQLIFFPSGKARMGFAINSHEKLVKIRRRYEDTGIR